MLRPYTGFHVVTFLLLFLNVTFSWFIKKYKYYSFRAQLVATKSLLLADKTES